MAEYIERDWLYDQMNSTGAEFDIIDALEMIENFPAADVAPVRRGNWEEWWPGIAEIMTGEEMLYRCSACDAKYADIDGYKYCPYCGAKMNKEETNELD